jgi:hypothetical protein
MFELLCVYYSRQLGAGVPKGVDQMPMWLLYLWGDLQRRPSNAARGPSAPFNAATLR